MQKHFNNNTSHVGCSPNNMLPWNVAIVWPGLKRIAFVQRTVQWLWTCVKPRPNDSNASTQHIPTLLAQYLQAPAKRSQHDFSTTYRNTVGRNMLLAFGHPVATFCDMLGIVNRTSAHARVQHCAPIWPNDYNITQHPQMLHEKFGHFQIWANNTNISQYLSTRWPNARNMLRLRSFPCFALRILTAHNLWRH